MFTSFIPAGSVSATSLSNGLAVIWLFNSFLAAFNSCMLFPSKEIETGLPAKLPPEPKVKLSTPFTLPTCLRIELVISWEEKSLVSPGNKLTVSVAFEVPGPILLMIFSTT